jgi:hypothetical protein
MVLNKSNLIGSGNSADTFKIQKKDSQVFYAAKIIRAKKDFLDTKDQLEYKREVEAL